ncbi:MAG: glycosyltransferase family 2 protein [Endomicrobiaceae bacterium]|nr:glycosyltransferase family 2 protein [Endomicrobiaceae bacterium]
MQVSIIIVNYKTKELAKDAIQSVFDKTEGINYEIIVIDNNSKDGSVEYLKNQFKDKIEVIDAGKNLGFGGGNNIGIRKAKGKYIFLLNPDTKLINNAIKILYDYMEQNEDVGACCGNLYDENMNPVLSFSMRKSTIFSYLYTKYSHIISKIGTLNKNKLYNYFNYGDKIKDVGYVSGADMFIRKSVLDKSGLFDEDIFMYGDDIDLSYRISKSGFKLKSIPQAKIIHLESKSTKNFQEKFKKSLNGEYRFYFNAYGYKTIVFFIEMQLFNIIKLVVCCVLPKKILKKIFHNAYTFNDYIEMIKNNSDEYANAKKQYMQNLKNKK